MNRILVLPAGMFAGARIFFSTLQVPGAAKRTEGVLVNGGS